MLRILSQNIASKVRHRFEHVGRQFTSLRNFGDVTKGPKPL